MIDVALPSRDDAAREAASPIPGAHQASQHNAGPICIGSVRVIDVEQRPRTRVTHPRHVPAATRQTITPQTITPQTTTPQSTALPTITAGQTATGSVDSPARHDVSEQGIARHPAHLRAATPGGGHEHRPTTSSSSVTSRARHIQWLHIQ